MSRTKKRFKFGDWWGDCTDGRSGGARRYDPFGTFPHLMALNKPVSFPRTGFFTPKPKVIGVAGRQQVNKSRCAYSSK
ncbi:hypothetical protein DVP68_04770 [Yersinia enterocolitica]|nr:hypothetical protein [Yersinia enterocolitica]EKN6365872.1 hypothetical protein [Yersinia enterocolitica]